VMGVLGRHRMVQSRHRRAPRRPGRRLLRDWRHAKDRDGQTGQTGGEGVCSSWVYTLLVYNHIESGVDMPVHQGGCMALVSHTKWGPFGGLHRRLVL
jgi:hypothetical protein